MEYLTVSLTDSLTESLTESEQMYQDIKFIPSEKVLGTSFRFQTNAFITDVHNALNTYLMKHPHIKYQYSSIDHMYRVVGYKDGLVDERFNIQVCCVAPSTTTDLFIYTNPLLYIVFTSEILSSSIISNQYQIFKDLKTMFMKREQTLSKM